MKKYLVTKIVTTSNKSKNFLKKLILDLLKNLSLKYKNTFLYIFPILLKI